MDIRKFEFKNSRLLARWLSLVISAILLVGCLPAGIKLPESPLLRNLERKSGLIAFVGTDGNIYTIDQGGVTLNPITSDAFASETSGATLFYQFPAWSSDGTQLAYVRFQGTTSIEQIAIIVSSPEGSESRVVYSSTDTYPIYLYWSPDMVNLAFLSMDVFSDSISLSLLPLEGGEAVKLAEGAPVYFDWSPDNKTIAVHSGGDVVLTGEESLSLMDVEGEVEADQVGYIPTLYKAPAWSPDGEELLVAAQTESGKHALTLLDQEGELKETLVTSERGMAFSWSPDNRHIAYLDKRQAFDSLQYGAITVIDKTAPEQPVTAGEAVVAYFWSPDGNSIAYFEPLLLLGEIGEESTTAEAAQIRLSILDIQSGEIKELAVFTPSTNFFNLLPIFEQIQRSATIWSPDSQKLVVSSVDAEGQPLILVVDTSGSLEPRPISVGLVAYWSWK